MSDEGWERSSLIVTGLLAAGVASAAVGVLAWRGAETAEAGRGADYANVDLTDQDGARQQLSAWAGRVVVLDFIYTGCGDICPLKTRQLAEVQQGLDAGLRSRVEFVSVSIDPEHDDPAALRAYAARNGAELSGWAFLTGPLGRIASFAAAFDPMSLTGGEAPSHITTVRLLDGSGKVVRRYIADPGDKARLLQDIAAVAATPSAEPPLAPTDRHVGLAVAPPRS